MFPVSKTHNFNNLIVADTHAPFDFFRDNGFYVVKNKIFARRLAALKEASQSSTDISWNFNNEVFSKIDWTKSTGINITELYRMRAQQLRDKYDYLIVAWSGGADSTTIVDSFLKNNILLDEIAIAWPVTQSHGKYTPNASIDATNMISEWDFTIKPKIDYIRKNYPHVKITVCDYLQEDINIVEDLEDTFNIVEKHSYISIKKFRALDSLLEKRTEQYKNIACLCGIAPVEPVLLDNIYFAVYFYDNMMNSLVKSDYRLNNTPRRVEFFYSTPDLPEIMQEQAHLLYNYFNDNPSRRSILPTMKLQSDQTFVSTSKGQGESLRHIRKMLVYPEWDLKIFQVVKPEMQVGLNEWYSWFYNNPHSKEFTDPWVSACKSEQALIDPKYMVFKNNHVVNYKLFTTKCYVVKKFINKEK